MHFLLFSLNGAISDSDRASTINLKEQCVYYCNSRGITEYALLLYLQSL